MLGAYDDYRGTTCAAGGHQHDLRCSVPVEIRQPNETVLKGMAFGKFQVDLLPHPVAVHDRVHPRRITADAKGVVPMLASCRSKPRTLDHGGCCGEQVAGKPKGGYESASEH